MPKRVGLLVSIAAAHVALIILLMNLRAEPHADIPTSSALSVALLRENFKSPKPVHAVLPTKPSTHSEAKPIPIVDPSPPTSTSNVGADDCPVLYEVQKAIIANPEAQAEIDQLPPEAQSLSDATVIWTTGWTEVASTPSAPLATVRNTIVETLGGIESPCLDAPIAGPRMIAVPSAGETRLLVIGSGMWSWQQLALSGGAAAATADVEPVHPIAAGTYGNSPKVPFGSARY